MTRNKKIAFYLTIAIIACISVYAVGAAGWDRDDVSFSVGAIHADAWNSCSDGTNHLHPPGHCSTTSTSATARLWINVKGEYVDYGSYSYTVGPINDYYCAQEDGAGIPTANIQSEHHVNSGYRITYSNCR